MKVVLLHGADAAEPPRGSGARPDRAGACARSGTRPTRVAVASDVEPVDRRAAARPSRRSCSTSRNRSRARARSSRTSPALLNLLGLRYTGSSPAGLLMAGDKSLTKKVLGFHGILTPQFATVFRGALDHVGDLEFPLIVKPPQEDASLGITSKSVVRDIKELLRDDGLAAARVPVAGAGGGVHRGTRVLRRRAGQRARRRRCR